MEERGQRCECWQDRCRPRNNGYCRHGNAKPLGRTDAPVATLLNDIIRDIISGMRYVLDTDVVTAAVRSPSGASAELLRLARAGGVTLLASVPLFLEYEAKCLSAEHRRPARLTLRQARQFLDALAVFIEPVVTHYLWRPQLRDPGDEMVLEAAVNGQADALVTFNRRDFGQAPSRFGIKLWLPSEALRKLQ